MLRRLIYWPSDRVFYVLLAAVLVGGMTTIHLLAPSRGAGSSDGITVEQANQIIVQSVLNQPSAVYP